MIRRVNIVGAQCNDAYAHHGQRLQEAILNLIELNFFRSFIPPCNRTFCYYTNGLAIRHYFPDTTHIKVNSLLAAIRPFRLS